MAKRAAPAPIDYAAQWNDEPAATELALPSGKRVLVREPDVLAMAAGGLIPNHLIAAVERRIVAVTDAGKSDQPAAEQPGDRLRRAAEFTEYVKVLVVGACVEPKVVFGEPGPGEVSVERIAPADRLFIWRWSEGLTEPLQPFRGDGDGADGTVPAVPDGEDVRDAAEPAGGADAA